MTRAPSVGTYRSRTIARAHTTAAAMPTPCSARQATSAPMSGASALPMLASTKTDSPPSSTGRRPKRSAIGPSSSWLKPKAKSSADSVSCVLPIGDFRSAASPGSAGRYRSVVIGCVPSSSASSVTIKRRTHALARRGCPPPQKRSSSRR